MMLFLKLINSSFKRNLKVYVPYLISMIMLVAINYIFKAVEINRSLNFYDPCNTCVYDLRQSFLMATASTRNGSL